MRAVLALLATMQAAPAPTINSISVNTGKQSLTAFSLLLNFVCGGVSVAKSADDYVQTAKELSEKLTFPTKVRAAAAIVGHTCRVTYQGSDTETLWDTLIAAKPCDIEPKLEPDRYSVACRATHDRPATSVIINRFGLGPDSGLTVIFSYDGDRLP